MKTNILNIATAAALLAVSASCADTWTPPTEQDGQVDLASIELSLDKQITEVQKSSSRAEGDDATADELASYIISVVDARTGATVDSYTYSERPPIVNLRAGDYRIDVESHTLAKTEWERPYYKGVSENFTITGGKIARVKPIVAKLASMAVSVRFDASIAKYLGKDVTVDVSVDSEGAQNGTLTYTPDETRKGYFEVPEGACTLVAHFKGTVSGVMTEHETPHVNIAAGQHQIITYRLNSAPIPDHGGTIDPSGGINIDASVEVEEIDENTTVDEDVIKNPSTQRPGTEEGQEPDPGPGPVEPTEAAQFVPSETSTNLDLDAVNIASESFGDAIVNINCAEGIANLLVTITGPVDFMTILSELDFVEPFDLAYPRAGACKENLDKLGLPNGEANIVGKNFVEFNITSFVPMLLIYEGDYKFKLEVTDAKGNKSALDLKFKS